MRNSYWNYIENMIFDLDINYRFFGVDVVDEIQYAFFGN
jgi:hypothetical protein